MIVERVELDASTARRLHTARPEAAEAEEAKAGCPQEGLD